jgi:CheY-like chemotaxis protein
MKKDKMNQWVKVSISIVALLLALIRWVFFDVASERMDSIFLLLLFIAVLVHIIPWENLKSIKADAGGFELILDQPQVKGALNGIEMKRIENEQLRESLSQLGPKIEQAKGSRVLWIDDNPHEILGERRLLRALGIDIVSAKDNESSERKLIEDNDFDLIISDVQRRGTIDNRDTRYGGIYFIKDLREKSVDPVIKYLPTIFYTAYTPDQIKKIKKDVGIESLSDIEFCYSIDTLLIKVITILSKVRSNPIKVSSQKEPTQID